MDDCNFISVSNGYAITTVMGRISISRLKKKGLYNDYILQTRVYSISVVISHMPGLWEEELKGMTAFLSQLIKH